MKKLNYSRSFLNDGITKIFKPIHGALFKGLCVSFLLVFSSGLFAQSYSVGSSVGTTSIPNLVNTTGSVMTCLTPPGTVVVGYGGRSGAFIDQVYLRYATLQPDGTLTNYNTLNCFNGGNGGVPRGPFTFSTPNAMVGAFQRGGDNLDQLRGYGKPISQINPANSNSTGTVSLPQLGGFGGNAIGPVYVPNGHVIVGMRFRETNNGQFAGAMGWIYAPISVSPTISCPNSSITLNNTPGECGAIANFSVSATGTPTPLITYSQDSGTVFPVGTTTVTATATNALGSTSCSFNVIVADNENPTITCPNNITANSDPGVCGAAVTYSVTSADNCAGEIITQTAGFASGEVFPVGTTTNTFVVTDASGNTATCSFDVTIFDN